MTRDDVTKDKLLQLLHTYGEHRWKCAITRRIFNRKDLDGSSCTCGWRLVLDDLKLWEVERFPYPSYAV